MIRLQVYNFLGSSKLKCAEERDNHFVLSYFLAGNALVVNEDVNCERSQNKRGTKFSLV